MRPRACCDSSAWDRGGAVASRCVLGRARALHAPSRSPPNVEGQFAAPTTADAVGGERHRIPRSRSAPEVHGQDEDEHRERDGHEINTARARRTSWHVPREDGARRRRDDERLRPGRAWRVRGHDAEAYSRRSGPGAGDESVAGEEAEREPRHAARPSELRFVSGRDEVRRHAARSRRRAGRRRRSSRPSSPTATTVTGPITLVITRAGHDRLGAEQVRHAVDERHERRVEARSDQPVGHDPTNGSANPCPWARSRPW